METPCGAKFEHKWHSYQTPSGTIKVCDGVFYEKKRDKK